MERSRLRFLAPEIRGIIYEFIFHEDCEIRRCEKISSEVIGYTNVNDIYRLGERYDCGILRMADRDDLVCCCPPAVSIIYTCKQISKESIPILYRTTNFDCTSIGLYTTSRLEYHIIAHDFFAFCNKIGRANVQNLRTWTFRWPCELADSIAEDWVSRGIFKRLQVFQYLGARYLPKCHLFVNLGLAIPHAELHTIFAKDAELYDLTEDDINDLHTRYLRSMCCHFDMRDLRTSFVHAATQVALEVDRLSRIKPQEPLDVWRNLIDVMMRRLEQQQKDLVWCWIKLEEFRRGHGNERVRFEVTALKSEVTTFETDVAVAALELIDTEKPEQVEGEKELANTTTHGKRGHSITSIEPSYMGP